MTRRVLGYAGVLSVLLMFVYIFRPVGHVPIYDANFVRLAETELEGYCSGTTFWQTSGQGDSILAEECREAQAGNYSESVNINKVEVAFCQGVVDQGWAGAVADCIGILRSQRMWPTYDGGLSQDWNRARPYPLDTIIITDVESDPSRTGERHPPGRVTADRSEYENVYVEETPEVEVTPTTTSTPTPTPTQTSETEEGGTA